MLSTSVTTKEKVTLATAGIRVVGIYSKAIAAALAEVSGKDRGVIAGQKINTVIGGGLYVPSDAKWYYGNGAPTTLHANGDFHMNLLTGGIYHQEIGVWVLVNNEGQQEITSYSAQADPNMSAGQPVYLKSNGHIELARANAIGTSIVAGLLLSDVLSTFAGSYIKDGSLYLADWTAVIGAASLTLGAAYYLDSDLAGRLTSVAPISVGEFVCPVGQAVNTKTLAIEIEPKILL